MIPKFLYLFYIRYHFTLPTINKFNYHPLLSPKNSSSIFSPMHIFESETTVDNILTSKNSLQNANSSLNVPIYDLIVIGAGSGGIATARRASKHNAKVLVVECGRMGGTCVNAGCVPKKVTSNLAHILYNMSPSICKSYGLSSLKDKETLEANNDKVIKESISSSDGKNTETLPANNKNVISESKSSPKDKNNEKNKEKLEENNKKVNSESQKSITTECESFINSIVDFEDFVSKRNNHVKKLNNIFQKIIDDDPNIDLVKGKGELHKDCVVVNNKKYFFKNCVLATGSQPKSLNNSQIKGTEFLNTSNDFFELKKVPKKSIIIGSGYIGIELGFILKALGSEVHIIARSNRLLSSFDDLLGECIDNAMKKKGIKVHYNTKVKEIKKNGMIIQENDKDVVEINDVDFMLCAIGRDCDLSFIKRDIESNKNYLLVDGNFRTSISNVFAIGDLIGPNYMLTPVAIFCGRILADHLFKKKTEFSEKKDEKTSDGDKKNMVYKEKTVYREITNEKEKEIVKEKTVYKENKKNDDEESKEKLSENTREEKKIEEETLVDKFRVFECIPSVIFSHPPTGSIGISEKEARKQAGENSKVKVYHSSFKNTYYALLENDEEKEKSRFKIVTIDDKVVGLHLFGTGVDEIVQGFAVAMKMGATFEDFKRTIPVHPTAGEEVITMN